MKWFN